MQNDKLLLSCPFCGGEAEMTWQRHGFDTMIYWIFCRECGCKQVASIHKESVINAWNTRKPMERIVEQLEESKTNYEHMGTIQSAYYDKGLDKAIEIVRKGGVDNAE